MGGPGEDSATSDGACGASDSDVAAFVLRLEHVKFSQYGLRWGRDGAK